MTTKSSLQFCDFHAYVYTVRIPNLCYQVGTLTFVLCMYFSVAWTFYYHHDNLQQFTRKMIAIVITLLAPFHHNGLFYGNLWLLHMGIRK